MKEYIHCFLVCLQLGETQAIIRTILDIQPQESGSSEATSSDDIALEMSKNISSHLAEKIIADEIYPHLKKVGTLSHLQIQSDDISCEMCFSILICRYWYRSGFSL